VPIAAREHLSLRLSVAHSAIDHPPLGHLLLLCPTKEKFGQHMRTAQARPNNQVPGSGAGKHMYHITRPLLDTLFGPSVLGSWPAWSLVAELSEVL
jgi:hypothetical protein